MIPPQQRFGAHDFACHHAELGLEGEHELAALNRLGQRPFGFDLLLMLGRQGIVEQAVLAAAIRLGPVHRDVGRAHQRFDARTMVGGDRNANRSADVDPMTAQLERLGNGQGDTARNAFDIGNRAYLREE